MFITEVAGSNLRLIDPLTGEAAGEESKGAMEKIKVNNKLRRVIRSAIGGLTLMSPDASVRRAAAEAIFQSRESPKWIELIDAALEQRVSTGPRPSPS